LNKKLLKTLIEQNLVHTETKVKIKVKAWGWPGPGLGAKFDTISNTNWNSDIKADTILEIDGMTPDRFAKVYNITPDGTIKIVKKRGRKPKHEQKTIV